MPGRHAQQPERDPRRRVIVLAAAAVLAVLAVGGLIWASGDRTTRATTVANQVGSSAAPTPAGNADDGASTADPDAPPAALASCADSLQRGAAVVAAADASRDHWGTHVRAQTDYDVGAISRQQMLDTFAATKASGPADLAAFDTAKAAYGPTASGCSGLAPDTMGQRWATVAAQCSQRATVEATALQAGDAMVADWRAHVEMMQNKPHTDPNAYGKMWRDMVNAAPPHLDAFATARDTLNQQPACQLTSG
jgi:hypothetical protein